MALPQHQQLIVQALNSKKKDNASLNDDRFQSNTSNNSLMDHSLFSCTLFETLKKTVYVIPKRIDL